MSGIPSNLEDMAAEALLFSDIIGNVVIELGDTDGIVSLKELSNLNKTS